MSSNTQAPDVPNLPKIIDYFDDTLETWQAYPLRNEVLPHRPILYMRERCRLATIFEDLHAVVTSSGEQHIPSREAFPDQVDAILVRLEDWHDSLPFELHYRWPMSPDVSVWELQYVYNSRDLCAQQAN
jgi:hypothetical protein